MDPMMESAKSTTQPVLTGHKVVDAEGEKLGVIDDVLFDAETNEAVWAVVKRGMLRPKPTVVPLTRAFRTDEGDIVVAFDKRTVASAPHLGADHVMSHDTEEALLAHYGV
jgi:sporulation protein YlmC with PRC-barrel domain